MNDHILYCGTRTELCDLCGRYVQLKDLEKHNSSGCNYPELVKNKAPEALHDSVDYANYACAMYDIDVEKVEDLIPCEFCFQCFEGDMLVYHQVCCFFFLITFLTLIKNFSIHFKKSECKLNPSKTPRPQSRAKFSLTADDILNDDVEYVVPVRFENQHRKQLNETKIPCEFCSAPIDITTLHFHQVCISIELFAVQFAFKTFF
jgi:hypothetical protein